MSGSVYDTDWSQFLGDESEIPHDVIFKVDINTFPFCFWKVRVHLGIQANGKLL